MKLVYLVLIIVLSTTTKAWNHPDVNSTKVPEMCPLMDHQEYSSGIWHDLITPDLKASKLFYKTLFGWSYKEENIKGFKYTIILNEETVIGGMIEVPNIQSSTWISSLPLEASELNSRIKLAISNGAKLAVKPLKVASLGKQVILEGPQGSVFSLSSKNAINSPAMSDSGTNSWLGIELWSDDPEQSKEFYEQTFEVETREVISENKPYWYFTKGEVILAGMIKNPVTNQGGQWVPYVKVASPSAMVTTTKQAGGDVILSPTDTIRNGKLGIIQDPHGALVAVQQEN
ncbi:VOC family protein [Aureitalea marina]|uniref:Glyoxalase/fosfomycin resistance/dioxygenase domain-containing protein n=1 Tax=Aureitalea marina TaxID=930804 RepID=A0A2S7KTB1_9FLAO|nr:VOC family protein [Aureitalea marina]PQB05862.1 hypothetical protein BST85_13865 [Aureitalea marina]